MSELKTTEEERTRWLERAVLGDFMKVDGDIVRRLIHDVRVLKGVLAPLDLYNDQILEVKAATLRRGSTEEANIGYVLLAYVALRKESPSE